MEDALYYLAKESKGSANKLLDAFYRAMEMLAANPFAGHKREDLTEQPVRFWPVKWHYLIIYKVAEPIEILRVLSGYRDIVNLLR